LDFDLVFAVAESDESDGTCETSSAAFALDFDLDFDFDLVVLESD